MTDPARAPDRPSRRAILAGTVGAVGTAGAVGAQALFASVAAHAGVRPRPSDRTDRPVPGRDFFVDPVRGDDSLPGTLPAPSGRPGNGPLATIDEAIRRAYTRAAETDEPAARVVVWLRGGTYSRAVPLTLTPHHTTLTVRIAAYPDEQPVVSGSQPITGWTTTTVGGREAWKATVPEATSGDWVFTQLYVNGAARPRPRLPKSVNGLLERGEPIPPDDPDYFHHFQAGTPQGTGPEFRSFVYRDGDIDPSWHDLTAVDVVAMDNWYDERSPIESVDPANRECTVAFRPYHSKAWGHTRYYYVENVFEALTEPGEWYLDRGTGEVYYLPRPGESLDAVEISAPQARRLLVVEGTADDPAELLEIDGVTFEHSTWEYWIKPAYESGQSAIPTIGAIRFREARDCRFVGCTVRTVGEYGIALDEGCERIEVAHNEIVDTGSGGLKLGSNVGYPGVDGARTGNNLITDNEVHHTGRVFHMGAGILARDTYGNTIAHNHVHDLYYTGISVGWNWSFTDHPARDNLVASNHIHHLSLGPLLSDLGGIYTLGVQPGTRIENNHIHDIFAHHYGAHGLYPDQASSYMRWENNVVHDAQDGLFLHYGAENTVVNNVFVRLRVSAVQLYDGDRGGLSDISLRVHGNVLAADHCPVFSGGARFSMDEPGVCVSDRNLLWNLSGPLTDDGTLDPPQRVFLVRASDGVDVPGASAVVTLKDGQRGEFVFAPLSSPVVLEPGVLYLVMTQTDVGGPQWYNPTPLTIRADATVLGSAYSSASGYVQISEPGRGFGPLNLRYTTPADQTEREFVTGTSLNAALRNDHPGSVGMTIEIGAEPLTITALGRMVPADTWWDLWRRGGRDASSVVADPRFVDVDSDDFGLLADSPALDPPVDFQPIDLSEVGPRDRPRS